MLGTATYSKQYISNARKAIAAGAAAVDGADNPETLYGLLIIAMDGYFVHRLRGRELKDGNPLNEVRMICASIMSDGGKLTEDKSIKYKPETSVLKLKIGQKIALNKNDFDALSAAFFDDIKQKFAAEK